MYIIYRYIFNTDRERENTTSRETEGGDRKEREVKDKQREIDPTTKKI